MAIIIGVKDTVGVLHNTHNGEYWKLTRHIFGLNEMRALKLGGAGRIKWPGYSCAAIRLYRQNEVATYNGIFAKLKDPMRLSIGPSGMRARDFCSIRHPISIFSYYLWRLVNKIQQKNHVKLQP